MNFTSSVFLLFFPVVLILYRLVPASWRGGLLLAGSLFFYWAGSRQALLLLLAVTVITWGCGLFTGSSRTLPVRRLCLILTWMLVCGILIWFRYLQKGMAPAGISFYTFQSLAYCTQVYRGEIRPERSIRRYALFISFFPQLVAGPIEQPQDLLPQLEACPLPDRKEARTGYALLLRGYFKKICIADFAAPFVDQVYASGVLAQGPAVLAGTMLFALQIYADFSGYSDIARGSAQLIGIRLSENFRMPYLAESMRDFWRRWHITLTRWFTQMIYIPLGGNQRGIARQCVLTMLVFFLSGVWHGAAWHFAVWGLIHGCFLVAETLLHQRRRSARSKAHGTGDKPDDGTGGQPEWKQWACRGSTFILTTLSWIFFRAASLRIAWGMLCRIPVGWGKVPGNLEAFALTRPTALLRIAFTVPVLYLLDIRFPRAERIPGEAGNPRDGRRHVLTACLLTLAIACSWLELLSSGKQNAFIYFRF